jgi:fused-like protein
MAGRNTVENREIVYDKQNNKKVEGPKHAAEDHHGSATGPGSDISILSECSALDKLEKTSQTVKGANAIIEDSEALSTALSPIKIWLSNTSTSPRELNIDDANQSLRIVKNLIEAGSYQSFAAIDDIICMFLECTSVIIKTKISDAYSFAVKCLAIGRKLLDTSEGPVLQSYDRHWSSLYELYSQVTLCYSLQASLIWRACLLFNYQGSFFIPTDSGFYN